MNKKRALEAGLDAVAEKAANGVDAAVNASGAATNRVVNNMGGHLGSAYKKLFARAKASAIVTPREMAQALARAKRDLAAVEIEGNRIVAVLGDTAEAAAPYAIRSVYDATNVAVAITGARPLVRVVDKVEILRSAQQLYWPRFTGSARRYAGSIGERTRKIMAQSAAAGESWGVMAVRLANDPKYAKLIETETGQLDALRIAEGSTAVARFWAQRLVRTEASYAYGQVHDEMIRWANTVDPGYLRRWSAAPDRGRTCPICQGADNTTAEIDGEFPGGLRNVPAHPMCRCVIVAWRKDWTMQSIGSRRKGEQYIQKAVRY